MTAAGVTPSGIPTTVTYGYGDADWGDKLTSLNGVTLTYDAVGNPLSYYNGLLNYDFTWINGRQLATATYGGSMLTFTYNDDGIRTSKTVNGDLQSLIQDLLRRTLEMNVRPEEKAEGS